MEYLVILERGEQGWGAYVPDLPGCVAVGETEDMVRELIREAMVAHLAALKTSGQPVPPSTTRAGLVRIAR
jgi:predicted RNase H-like HicB family nuclease